MTDAAPALVALVCDDHQDIREVLRTVLEDLGASVLVAGDGREALDQLERHPVDLMLLDLSMPRLDGFEVMGELRKHPGRYGQPATIVVSANADHDGKVRGTELGAVDFIDKPFRLPALRRRLDRLMGMVRLEQGLVVAEIELERMRARDPATGLGSFGMLQMALDAQFATAQLMGKPLSCLVAFDAGYDAVLSQQGLEAADERLKGIASEIEGALRGADLVFRVDAAEFVVLLPGTPVSGAKLVAKRLREALVSRVEALFIAVASYPHPELAKASALFRAANVTLAQCRSRTVPATATFEGF